MTADLVSERLALEGKRPWTFSTASNTASVGDIERSAFQRRFSLLRRNLVVWRRVSTREVTPMPSAPMEVSIGA